METKLSVEILPQPDNTTCGPTCLHSIYAYHDDTIELEQVVAEVRQLEQGGTLAVYLACHALRRGYDATIYTYNLQMFDPTWFDSQPVDIGARLQAQAIANPAPTLQLATAGYLEFLRLGGRLRFEDLTTSLIRKYLNRGVPILTGLSATYLHRTAREYGSECVIDDVRGEPAGHFVVLCGYEKEARRVLVADPLLPNPISSAHLYLINIDRVICSILLGILTHDANLLIIEPRRRSKHGSHADATGRQ